MVAKYKNTLLVSLLAVLLSACWVNNEITNADKELIEFAYAKMTATIEQLNKKIEDCSKIQKKALSDQSIEIIKSINLTDEELKNAIFYFFINADQKCQTKELWIKVAAQTAEIEKLEEHFNNEFIVLNESDLFNICCSVPLAFLSAEMNYLKINESKRVELEQIAELQKPFNDKETLIKLRHESK